jgi:TRAP-type mannitol/chloroaromatic compound transport system permease large subunit
MVGCQVVVPRVGTGLAQPLVVDTNTTLENGQVTEITALILALALVLPVLGAVIYGFETGWDALGFGALGVMALLLTAYYVILRMMLRYRQKFTATFRGGR